MTLYRLTMLRLKTYFRNPLLILALSLFLVVLWGILNFTNISQKEVFTLPIGVVDLDETKYSQLITQRVAKKDTISIIPFSQEEALKQVSTGKLEAVYILKQGLMDKVLEGDVSEIIEMVTSPVSLSAQIIGELFSAEVMRLSSNVDAARDVVKRYGSAAENKNTLWNEAWDLTDGYWEPVPVITIDYHSTNQTSATSQKGQETAKIKENLTEILILTLLMFSILIASGTLLNEKNNGTIRRIMTTGTPLWAYILSSILSIIILHTIGLLVMMAFTKSSFIQLDDLMKQFVLYIMYMVWAGALGIMVVAFTKKMQQLLIIIPFIAFWNGLLIWKLQGYNYFISSITVFTLFSIAILILAIKVFSSKV